MMTGKMMMTSGKTKIDVKNSLLVYSKTSAEKAKNLFDIEVFDNRLEVNSNTDYDSLDPFIGCSKMIVGFGGGTAIDIAKYIAYHSEVNCIAIPTMLSTNVFSTNKTCVKRNGIKSTENSAIPEVFILNDILNLSKQENLYGLVDALSIYTASKDWEIADKNGIEKIDSSIMNASQAILEDALEFDISSNNWYDLYKIIERAGVITNTYGSGRPESGSEHIFSKYLEEMLKVPHAVGVSIGIVAMSNINGFQKDKTYYRVLNKLKETGIFDKAVELKVSIDDIKKVLSILEPRKDRYTILDAIASIDIENTLEGITNEIDLC